MKAIKKFWPLISILFILIFFFYPTFFKGQLPFPGNLIVGNYAPWTSSSFLGYPPGGVPHKAQGSDVVRQLFPWKHFSVEMIKKRELPFWNPYNFSGTPHLANFQTGVFYPLAVVFLFLPFNFAWTIFIIIQPLLAFAFVYLFARELKISRFGSLMSGVAFAFSLYFTVWLEWGNIGHSILWLPLTLFLLEKMNKKLSLKWFFFLVFSLSFSLLAGYIQTTIYIFIIDFLYFFFRLFSSESEDKIKKTILFLLSLGLPLFITSFQLFPTIKLFFYSAREAYPKGEIAKLLLPWFYPLTAFIPDFFGNPASRNYWYPGTYIERVSYLGVLPLFFAFLAFAVKKRKKIIFFFGGLAIFSFLFSLNIFPIRFFYSLKIPIISTMVYSRLLSVFAFSAAMLSGFGVDCWLKAEKMKRTVGFVISFLAFYMLIWLFVLLAPAIFPKSWWIGYLSVAAHNLILPTFFAAAGMGLIISSFRFPGRKFFFLGVFSITIFDLFFYFHKITPFSAPEFVYPQTEVVEFLQKNTGIDRFWGYGSAYIESNFSTFFHLYSIDGYDPLFIRRYGELISISKDGRIKDHIPRADVVLAGGYGQEDLKRNYYRQRLLNLLGVKYLLHRNDSLSDEWRSDNQTFPQEIYRLIWQKGKWQVYENKKVLSRAFLAYDYKVAREKQKIVDLILDKGTDLSKTIILEEEPQLDIKQCGRKAEKKGKTAIRKYTPNQVEIETNAFCPALLFLSDSFYPDWKAKIDGREVKIYRADYTFRAVAVPRGEHEITFYYKTIF